MSQTKRFDVAATILLAIFVLQVTLASTLKSPTSDERPHIAAGLSYLANHTIQLNPEHPPLLKELGALSLSIGGIHWPIELTTHERNLPPEDLQWSIGDRVIVENGPDRTMLWARLPMILDSFLLGVVIYAWGGQMLGKLSALCALFLYVFDPIILGHSYLVTTDTGFATFALIFLFCFWKYQGQPSRTRLIACGVALGAAMSAKFSGVALIPVMAILAFAPASRSSERRSDRPQTLPRTQSIRGSLLVLAAILTISFVVVQMVYFFPADLLTYARNYTKVYLQENPNYPHLMGGKFGTHFYSYLSVAYLLKEPIPGIVLAILGIWILVCDQSRTLQTKLFLILPPVVFWVAYSIKALNTGVRYLIPALPFLFLLGGVAMVSLLTARSFLVRLIPKCFAVWIVVAAAGIYPDHLSYFNEAACLFTNPGLIGVDGGSNCGTFWLDDSNVDWGQGMKQLKVWLDKNSMSQPVRLANFEGIPPEAYGIRYEPIDFKRDIAFPTRAWYVVSAHFVARVRAELRSNPLADYWLTRPPDAIIGHAYYVYNLN